MHGRLRQGFAHDMANDVQRLLETERFADVSVDGVLGKNLTEPGNFLRPKR